MFTGIRYSVNCQCDMQSKNSSGINFAATPKKTAVICSAQLLVGQFSQHYGPVNIDFCSKQILLSVYSTVIWS